MLKDWTYPVQNFKAIAQAVPERLSINYASPKFLELELLINSRVKKIAKIAQAAGNELIHSRPSR